MGYTSTTVRWYTIPLPEEGGTDAMKTSNKSGLKSNLNRVDNVVCVNMCVLYCRWVHIYVPKVFKGPLERDAIIREWAILRSLQQISGAAEKFKRGGKGAKFGKFRKGPGCNYKNGRQKQDH